MSIGLHNLTKSKGRGRTKKRLGRGLGSGLGTTAGRGQKGQKSRSGASGFQRRGMRKLMLATPKLRGFNSPHAKMAVVNVSDIAKAFGQNEIVTPKQLVKKGLIVRSTKGVKVLGKGEIELPVKVQGCAVSKTAAEKIIAAGGEVIA